ncbi:MAG: Uncharacterized protein G01um101416_399 [Microgenomates group bacterium Gr01-1014_16]|nr:MAG: Uncharacterized protein G01um101416_399 [Microgenomates group bacterium Gr01-1014_16]
MSSKLKLYDVAKSSSIEALEDFEDILRREHLSRWTKSDPRLANLRQIYEGYPISNPSNSPNPPLPSRLSTEVVANYMIDLLLRGGYLLDRQINAVEEKHRLSGGYNENLLRRRLEYRRSNPHEFRT